MARNVKMKDWMAGVFGMLVGEYRIAASGCLELIFCRSDGIME